MLGILPLTNQISLATNQVVAGYEKFLQKLDSSFTFYNKISTCCAFYQPKPKFFCSKWHSPCVWCNSCMKFLWIIQSEVNFHTTCSNLICCKTALNLGSKTCNIAFHLVFCWKIFLFALHSSWFPFLLQMLSRVYGLNVSITWIFTLFWNFQMTILSFIALWLCWDLLYIYTIPENSSKLPVTLINNLQCILWWAVQRKNWKFSLFIS